MRLEVLRSWKVRSGLIIIAFSILIAVFGPMISGWLDLSPRRINYDAIGAPPSLNHWFGTTLGGHDVFAQMLYGARGSVFVGLLAGTISVVIAVVVGTWSGYVGGALDRFTVALINVLMTMPGLAVMFIIAGYIRETGMILIAIVIGLLSWPGGARVIRAQTLSLRNRDFTAALRAIGEKRWRIVIVEILPHLMGVVSAMFLSAMVAGIFAEASLAFLGIGNVDGVSWGMIISHAQTQGAILRGMWWWFLPPGLMIALIGFATAMVNFGLDEVTNPRLNARLAALTRKFEADKRKKATR
ncbi:ABC transporter permease [Pseudactinotalea sp. Z1748]|uniref:ABC transporter permease n=1 Tax=Pseudactinotalea sp. Z1748 TaxID=3413027 RepID=UPI003C7BA240